MPVKLAQTAGFEPHDGCGNVCNREIPAVDDFDFTTGGDLGRRDSAGAEDKFIVDAACNLGGLLLLFGERPRRVRGEDVQSLFRDVVKGGRGRVEVLCQNFLGRVLEPVAEQEGGEFVEVSLVEDEQ